MPGAQLPSMAQSLSAHLKDQEYCLLTTFKKNGDPVPTPMWFVLEDEAVYMTTRGGSWKIKRLKRDPAVTIGPCSSSGRPRGEMLPAQGSVLEEPDDIERWAKALNKKYGLKKKLIDFGLRFAADKTEAIIKVELKAS